MAQKSAAQPVIHFDDEVIQRALTAAEICVERHGISKLSIEHIVDESGISRATLYRRFGSRDAILLALLRQQARPYTENTIHRALVATSLAERIEIGTVCAVMELPSYKSALKTLFSEGTSTSVLELIRPIYRSLVDETLLPSLEAAKQTGELRDGLNEEEVTEWLLRMFLLLVSDGPWGEQALLKYIRQFILPVLINDGNPAAHYSTEHEQLSQRLDNLEVKVTDILQIVKSLNK